MFEGCAQTAAVGVVGCRLGTHFRICKLKSVKGISVVQSVALKFAIADIFYVNTKCSVKISVLGKCILIYPTPITLEDDY